MRRSFYVKESKEKIHRTKVFSKNRLDLLWKSMNESKDYSQSIDVKAKKRRGRMKSFKIDATRNPISPLQTDIDWGELSALHNKITLEKAFIKDERKYSALSNNVDKIGKDIANAHKVLANIVGKNTLQTSPKKTKYKNSLRNSSLNLGLQTIQENNKTISNQLLLPKLNKSSKSIFNQFDSNGTPTLRRIRAESMAVGLDSEKLRNKRGTIWCLSPNKKISMGKNSSCCFSPSKKSSDYFSSSPRKSATSKKDIENMKPPRNFKIWPIEFKDSSVNLSEKRLPVKSTDWYFQGKLKFIAKRIFCHKFDPNEDYSVKSLEKGVWSAEKCK